MSAARPPSDKPHNLVKPSSSSPSLSPLTWALIGGLVGASCLYGVFDARGALGISCRLKGSSLSLQQEHHQQHDVTAVSNTSTTGENGNITTFTCPPPIPCTPTWTSDQVAQKLLSNSSSTWTPSTSIPLANRSMVIRGQPGVCTEDQTRRVFVESGVDLKSLMQFEPCHLFNLIRGRTLWIVGDSQGHSLLRACQAFMSMFAKTQRDVRSFAPIGIASLDYVLTFAVTTPPMCINLGMDGKTRICYVRLTRSSHKELQYTMEILSRAIPHFRHHFLAFNFGLHYRPTPWQLERDLVDLAEFRLKMRETMGADYLPRMIWIDTPPQHFTTPRGEYEAGKNLTTDACAPYDKTRLERNDRGMFNTISDSLIANISDAHAQTWDFAKRSWFAHMRVGDCTHYCRPGVPELWVYALAKAVKGLLSKDNNGCLWKD